MFSHMGQSVRDVDASRRFYTEVFGFVEVLDLDVSGAHSAKLMRMPELVELRAVYLRKDGFVLELLAFGDPTPLPPRPRSFLEPGLTHISIGVDDIDASCALVVQHGGTVLEESRLPQAIFVADPDGQVVELLAGHRFADRLHADAP